MKVKHIVGLLFCAIILVAMLTNPNQERHKEAVRAFVNLRLQKETKQAGGIGHALGMIIGGTFVDNLVNQCVSVDNYILFSLTKITWDGATKIIGIGVLGNVFIPDDIIPYGGGSVKTGQLNYIMQKGDIFKTYEGKLIQTGIKTRTAGGIESNEFEFSVDNEELAKKLMDMAGQNVKLHYTEYSRALPWRGNTRYIVDSIVSE